MSQRVRNRIRRGIFARRYVPPLEEDTTPDPFAFADVTDAEPGSVHVSNQITITGIDAPVLVGISLSGGPGEYRKNGGSWTDSLGSVDNFAVVEVRVTASTTPGAAVAATLTVGGFADTFTVTTRDGGALDFSDPDNSGFIATI